MIVGNCLVGGIVQHVKLGTHHLSHTKAQIEIAMLVHGNFLSAKNNGKKEFKFEPVPNMDLTKFGALEIAPGIAEKPVAPQREHFCSFVNLLEQAHHQQLDCVCEDLRPRFGVVSYDAVVNLLAIPALDGIGSGIVDYIARRQQGKEDGAVPKGVRNDGARGHAIPTNTRAARSCSGHRKDDMVWAGINFWAILKLYMFTFQRCGNSLDMADLASPRPSEDTLKICIMGDPLSGKTELTMALMHNANSALRSEVQRDIAYITGQDLATGRSYFLQFWDTPGTINHSPYEMAIMLRDTVGVFLLFDLTNRASYDSVDRWIEEIRARFRPSPKRPGVLMPFIYLVGCKLDLAEYHGQREVEWDEIDAKATENGWGCAQISAKEPCLNLQELLEHVIAELLRDKIARERSTAHAAESPPTSPRITPRLLSFVFRTDATEHKRNPLTGGC